MFVKIHPFFVPIFHYSSICHSLRLSEINYKSLLYLSQIKLVKLTLPYYI